MQRLSVAKNTSGACTEAIKCGGGGGGGTGEARAASHGQHEHNKQPARAQQTTLRTGMLSCMLSCTAAMYRWERTNVPVYAIYHDYLIIFRTTVPFWEQTTQISSRLSPKGDCGAEGGSRRGVRCTRLFLASSHLIIDHCSSHLTIGYIRL